MSQNSVRHESHPVLVTLVIIGFILNGFAFYLWRTGQLYEFGELSQSFISSVFAQIERYLGR